MAKYVNKTRKMQIVKFEDGTAVFMYSGQKLDTNKKIKELPKGVEEVKSQSSRSKKSSVDSIAEDSTIS